MTPKTRRDRLFRRTHPTFRPLEIYDGERYHRDVGILWAAHQARPFQEIAEVTNQAEFAEQFAAVVTTRDVVMADDHNRSFRAGRGPVAVCSSFSDGWRIEPHVEFFHWATPRNVLRATVAYFQMIRHSRAVGCGVVLSMRPSRNLFKRCCEYGVLSYVGRLPNGDRRGDLYLFAVRGRKHERKHRTG